MHKIEDLLLEKRRYGLPEVISEGEFEKLLKGYPIQKIMGFIEMQNVRININKNVLIPRYETEELILESYNYIKNKNDYHILDLCTGSGFIALAIKKNFPLTNITATDISDEAIDQAKENSEINNLKINIKKSDLFAEVEKNAVFDLIISNPPYLNQNIPIEKYVLNFEPHIALFAKKNGFEIIEKIIFNSKKYLKKNGILLLEIDEEKVQYINKIVGINTSYIKDINGKIRIAKITY